MTYKKVKADFMYEKNRLYRVFLVRSDIDLFEFGLVIGSMFKATFEHMFSFSTKDKDYYMECSRSYMQGVHRAGFISEITLDDLGNLFEYNYDSGDCWDFKCRIYKREVKVDSDKTAILLEGKGQGIWEDNRYTLNMYFNGEIDPKFSGEDEDRGIYKPWNVELKKFGDFDKPLNIKREQKIFDKLFDEAQANMSNEVAFDDEDDMYMPPMDQLMEDFGEFLAEKYGIDISEFDEDNDKIVELFPDNKEK